MLSRCRTASERRFRTTIPQPSPRTIPFAPASNALQRPSGDNTRAFDNAIVATGERIRFTPPARAWLHSPFDRLRQARCTATREDEQPVSIATQGPWNPNVYDNRPAAALRALPVMW